MFYVAVSNLEGKFKCEWEWKWNFSQEKRLGSSSIIKIKLKLERLLSICRKLILHFYQPNLDSNPRNQTLLTVKIF